MVALPNAGNVVRLDFQHTESGDPLIDNRTFWSFSGASPSVSNMNDLAGFAEGFWVSDLKGLATSQTVLTGIVATDLTTNTASRGSWSGSEAGNRSGGPLPNEVVTLLNFEVLRRYRGGKPRMYAPWGTVGDLLNEREWDSTYIGDVNTAWASFAGSMIGQGFGSCAITAQVNVSYYEGVNTPITLPSGRVKQSSKVRSATQVDIVSGHSCNQYLGSQRRRTRA